MKYFFLWLLLSSLITNNINARVFEIGDTRIELGDLKMMVETKECENDNCDIQLVARAKTKYGKKFYCNADYIAIIDDLIWSYNVLRPYLQNRTVYIDASNHQYRGISLPIKLGSVEEDGTLILDQQYQYEAYLDFDVQSFESKITLNFVGLIFGFPPINWKNEYSMRVKIANKDQGFAIGFNESFFFYGRFFSLRS